MVPVFWGGGQLAAPKREAADSSKTLIPMCQAIWSHNQKTIIVTWPLERQILQQKYLPLVSCFLRSDIIDLKYNCVFSGYEECTGMSKLKLLSVVENFIT
jgi:hypothetical protein